MSFWKTRADIQDRYRREIFAGVIAAVHDDGTYDVYLPGVAEPVCGVLNGSDLVFQEGNRIIVQRAGDRNTWQIHASLGQIAPQTRSWNPEAVLDVPPLVYWDGLARDDDDAETIAHYVDTHTWPLGALERGDALDGQVPCWSDTAQAWVPGAGGGSGGIDVAALQSPAAAALAALVTNQYPVLTTPAGVGAWMMHDSYQVVETLCRGAFIYDHPSTQSVRAGAYSRGETTLAYWKMDELGTWDTAVDQSGRVNDLVPYGFEESILSNFYRARQMNGAWSYGQAPALPVIGSCHLTIQVWIKPVTLGDMVLFYQSGTASLQFDDSGTKLRYYVTTTAATVAAEATVDPQALCDGQWHYLAGVYDSTGIQLYLDGTAVGTCAAQSGTLAPAFTGSCYVGVYAPTWTTWSRYYHGAIQEICLETRARTAAEIAAAWEGRQQHQAVLGPVQAPCPWRHVMLGHWTINANTPVTYEVSGDDGVTWTSAAPWGWTTVAEPGTGWLVRATLSELAEIKRLGLIGMP